MECGKYYIIPVFVMGTCTITSTYTANRYCLFPGCGMLKGSEGGKAEVTITRMDFCSDSHYQMAADKGVVVHKLILAVHTKWLRSLRMHSCTLFSSESYLSAHVMITEWFRYLLTNQ